MKKVLFSLFSFLLIASFAYSQDDPKKALTKAGRALSSYNLDPTNNSDKLDEAIQLIKIAAESAETNDEFKTWHTRGDIYLALSDKDIAMMAVDSEYKPKHPDAPYIAAESFIKASELAEKKYEKKDALKGLQESAGKLNLIGNYQIQETNYEGAFKSLNKVLELNEIIIAQGEDPVIKEDEMGNHKFVLAYCAQASGNDAAAKKYFKDLYESGSAEPGVYASYFNILMAEENEDALEVLEEGREKFPDNSEILFAEINYYIQQQDYENLEEKLKEAIRREPNNPSIYSALGNVYMNLFTEEFGENRNSELAESYFNKSLEYFEKAVEIEPNQFDAIYSIGSLYFNRAVELLKYASTLDISEQEEYEKVNKEATALMEKALPYFKKAEAINPNDPNTLIALSETFARMNDFEKSSEFKKRLEVVKGGGQNEASYFNN